MKALEFETQISTDHTMPIPSSVTAQLPSGQTVRVLVLVPDLADEEAEWERMASSEFLKGYAESDAIYDQLSGR